MTPLFQRIARELTRLKKDRTFEDHCGLLGMLDDVHCFEVTEVHPLAVDLAEQYRDEIYKSEDPFQFRLMNVQTFLPAPKTWIEWTETHGGIAARIGYLFVRNAVERHATVFGAYAYGPVFCSTDVAGALLLAPSTVNMLDPEWTAMPTLSWAALGNANGDHARWQTLIAYALLAIINTPRIIGRKQHMPHRGLERALIRSLGAGRFPLHAWTEVVLSMKFREDGDGDHETHLTGQRCLHFCRAHLRVRQGQLQFVRAHWRGDPALGMKRTRYRLTT